MSSTSQPIVIQPTEAAVELNWMKVLTPEETGPGLQSAAVLALCSGFADPADALRCVELRVGEQGIPVETYGNLLQIPRGAEFRVNKPETPGTAFGFVVFGPGMSTAIGE
jgi:hypothetical protein